MTVNCKNCENEFEIIETTDNEFITAACPHCNYENEVEILNSQIVPEKKDNTSADIAFGLKLYDYILGGICFLEGILKIIRALYIGRGISWFFTSEGLWTFLPFIAGVAVLQHKKGWRIIATIVFIISCIVTYYILNTLEMPEF